MPTQRRKKREDGMIPVPNPLAIIFGQALSRRFRVSDVDSNKPTELAKKLGLSLQTYRLIEIGESPLHPSRSLDLAKELILTWPRLARVLAAIQVLEKATSSYADLFSCKEYLEAYDPEISEILNSPKWLWQMIEQKAKKKERLSANTICKDDRIKSCAASMERFLCGESADDEGIQQEDRLSLKIGNIPPYYLEPLNKISDLYIEFSKMPPPRITDMQLGEFERNNSKRFERIYALLHSYDSLRYMTSKQSHIFEIPYILNENFDGLDILLACPNDQSTALSESALQKKLHNSIQKSIERDTKQDPAIIKEMVKRKVTLKVLPPNHPLEEYFLYNSIKDEKGELPENDEDKSPSGLIALENIWVYCLRDPQNTIVFLDNFNPSEIGTVFTTSCTRTYTKKLLDNIKGYWEPEQQDEKK